MLNTKPDARMIINNGIYRTENLLCSSSLYQALTSGANNSEKKSNIVKHNSDIRNLNRPYRFFLQLLLTLTMVTGGAVMNTASADHVAGTDLSYTCVAGQPGVYHLIFSFYRTCSGISVC